MSTRISGKNKKLLRNTLFLVKLDDREIVTGFYNEKQGCNKGYV